MGKSMRHLFIMGTILDDVTKCTNTIRGTSESISMLGVFVVFIVVSCFTLLNMLIGILCEVVQATSEGERLKSSEARIHDAIEAIFTSMDEDHSGTLTKEEFMDMENNDEILDALAELRVKTKHFRMYADLMFAEEDDDNEDGEPSITLGETIDMIMQLRPGTKVSALDFATFTQAMHKNHFQIKNAIIRVDRYLAQLMVEEGLVERKAKPKPAVPTVEDLERIPDQDIIAELNLRLGIAVKLPDPDDPIISTAKAVEAFASLGVPMEVDDDITVTDLYTC